MASGALASFEAAVFSPRVDPEGAAAGPAEGAEQPS